MTSNQHTIYLGLGTNLGDRLANLQAALDALPPRVTVLAVSPIFKTPPWGYTDQAEFLNLVLRAETGLNPRPLLRYLKSIEKKVGRTATFRWGPREIDIDILFYDDLVYQDRKLAIPHPRLHKRAFMLVPLATLAPDMIHPLTGQAIQEHLEQLETNGIVKINPLEGEQHGP